MKCIITLLPLIGLTGLSWLAFSQRGSTHTETQILEKNNNDAK